MEELRAEIRALKQQVVEAAMRGDSAEQLAKLVDKIRLPEQRANAMSKSSAPRAHRAARRAARRGVTCQVFTCAWSG